MSSMHRFYPLLLFGLGLSSCDSLKQRAVTFLDEKIQETGAQAEQVDVGEEIIRDPEPLAAAALPGGLQTPIRNISDQDYDEFIKTPDHVVVVDFYADWCGPCRRLTPILESIVDKNRGKVLLGKMDIDKNKSVPAREGVRGIPDVRIFVNGKQVDKFVGLPPAKRSNRTWEKFFQHPSRHPSRHPNLQSNPRPKTNRPRMSRQSRSPRSGPWTRIGCRPAFREKAPDSGWPPGLWQLMLTYGQGSGGTLGRRG